MHPLAEIEQAHKEWVAWRTVCQQLEGASASIKINDEPLLHSALVAWGEELAALRSLQDPDDCFKWLREARDKAPAHQEEPCPSA